MGKSFRPGQPLSQASILLKEAQSIEQVGWQLRKLHDFRSRVRHIVHVDARWEEVSSWDGFVLDASQARNKEHCREQVGVCSPIC